MAFFLHPDIHMAFSQQRRSVLYGTSFGGSSRKKTVGQPIHASDDTLFSVHLYRKYIYDFILSLSRSLPFRAFETGQMV